MTRKIAAMLTLLGAVFAVGLTMAEVVDPDAEGVSAPYLIAGSRVTPSYPPAAYAAKYEGVVSLKAVVNADGSVGDIEVLDSSRKSVGFEAAAIDAVSQWQFEPARKADSAVDSYTLVRLRFNPPSRSSRGSVASAFANTPLMMPASGPSMGKLGASSVMSKQSARQLAWLPTQYFPVQKYGMPNGRIGSIYDRRDMIPPGTGGRSLQAK